MADIIINPGSSIMSFTSSLNYTQTLTQDVSGSLILAGSGSTGRTDLFTVNGNNGTLFSVSDDLSDSLFSVNTIAGLPVIEAFANNTVVMGQYGQNVLVVTGSNVGIGTSAPTYKLQVQGTGYFNGTLYVNGATTIEDTFTVKTQDGSYTTAVLDYSGGAGGRLKLYTDGVLRTQIGSYFGDDTYFNVGYGGNVGIGLTNPSARLDIRSYASAGATNAPTLRAFGYDTDSYFEVNNNGNNSADIKLTRSDGATMFKIDGHSGITYFAGQVGIGTTNPDTTSGYGTVTMDGSSGTFTEYRQNGTGLFRIGVDGSRPFLYGMTDGKMDFFTNTTFRMTIATDGNVGIGTTTPSGQMSGTTGLAISHTNYPAVGWRNSTTSWLWYGEGATFKMWNASAGDILTGNSSGNIGIGTSSPTEKLDVRGTIRVSKSGVNDSGILAFGNYANGAGYYDNGIFRSALNDIATAGNKLHIASYEALVFTTSAHAFGSQSIRMYIDGSSGNVGIGTTNPGQKLSIVGGSSTYAQVSNGSNSIYLGQVSSYGLIQSDLALAMLTDGSEKMRILAGGNVGIGTTNPGYKLDVNGASRFIFRNSSDEIMDLLLSTESAASKSKLSLLWYGNETAALKFTRGGNSTGGSLELWTQPEGGSTTQRMTIATSGNVGIGVTNPSQLLHVAGTAYASSDFRAPIFYDSDNTSYYLDPSGASILNTVRAYKFENVDGVSTDSTFGLYFGNGDGTPYAIYREAGSWTHPYPDLRIAFHTGIKMGANASYNGMRFYNDYDMATQVMSINNSSDGLGANNVYVNNSLQAGSSLRAPIFYDSNDTGYYGDFAGTSNLYGLTVNQTISGNISGNSATTSAVSGTTNYVPKFTSSTAIGNSAIYDSSGNIGIGTTSPNYKLDVNGYLGASRLYPYNTNSTYIAGDGSGLTIDGSGYLYVPASGGSYFQGQVRFRSSIFNDSGAYLHINGGTSNITYINGTVGIGVTNPIAALDHQASAGSFRQRGFTTVVTNSLGANGEQARRYEIARASIDFNDWNDTGTIEIELHEKYWSDGLKKKYMITYGYQAQQQKFLVEMSGYGSNNFQVTLGTPVVISGDNRYLPIYVDLRYYSYCTAIVKSNRELTTSNPPGIGGIWFNNAPSGTNISDFTPDSTVYVGNVIGGASVFSSGNVGIGTTSPTTRLHVETAESEDGIRLSNGGTTKVIIYNSGFIDWGNAADFGRIGWDTGKAVIDGKSGKALSLGAGGTSDYLWIATGGNVGIGTTSPDSKLHVAGNALVTNITYNESSLGTSNVAGEVVYFGGGTGLTAGNVVYLNSSGNWVNAQADSTSTATGMLGIALSDTGAAGVLVRGNARFTGNGSYTTPSTTGIPLYLSANNAGAFKDGPPGTSGHVVRIIGYMTSASDDQIYFCPDNTWIEL